MAGKNTTIHASIPVIYLKEGESFICYSPAFDLAAHGSSFEDARRSFTKTVKLFMAHVTKKGTWGEVLREYGWKKNKRNWDPPRVIGQGSKVIELPVPA
ncbi:MAG: hypothetical protein HYW65_02275 [Candidatus Liptonbacteria bacterium]|nr:hypothetical protein [Candidatus Liptonbacteria bacterium]